jgi:GTP cyclohydrolase II
MSLDVLSCPASCPSQAHCEPDFDLLNLLTVPAPQSARNRRREGPLDPLLLAAASGVGPHIPRHHYHQDVGGDQPVEEAVEATSSPIASVSPTTAKPKFISRQTPWGQRLDKENDPREPLQSTGNLPQRRRGLSLHVYPTNQPQSPVFPASPVSPSTATRSAQIIQNPLPVNAVAVVKCMARTRIPTPYGPAFLHLYKNNIDEKEHLAIVADSAQLEAGPDAPISPLFIRSKSLEAQWSDDETEADRLTRGAYVGRLTPLVHIPSVPSQQSNSTSASTTPSGTLPPFVRIHSECFTGETIGSMRCDCGEQLDEALRLISLPLSATSPGRGAVVYLRQEGRGIGLLSKIRAYNLQDMGHDTVQANLLLGHGADERRYDIAAAILRDLGLDNGIELLTNNPDKVGSLEKEGIKVVQRRAMVPRSWQKHSHSDSHIGEENPRTGGVTMIGGSVTHGPELEKYLRTKVERMGHMLDLPKQD